MEFLNQFELMKVEKLQIVNSLPRSLVVLYALVEECEDRFGEETSESIIEKINELFPIQEEEEEEEAGEEKKEKKMQKLTNRIYSFHRMYVCISKYSLHMVWEVPI